MRFGGVEINSVNLKNSRGYTNAVYGIDAVIVPETVKELRGVFRAQNESSGVDFILMEGLEILDIRYTIVKAINLPNGLKEIGDWFGCRLDYQSDFEIPVTVSKIGGDFLRHGHIGRVIYNGDGIESIAKNQRITVAGGINGFSILNEFGVCFQSDGVVMAKEARLELGKIGITESVSLQHKSNRKYSLSELVSNIMRMTKAQDLQ